jgi:hypothetical protein
MNPGFASIAHLSPTIVAALFIGLKSIAAQYLLASEFLMSQELLNFKYP